MSAMENAVTEAIGKYSGDSSKLLDIIREVQGKLGCISDDTSKQIAKGLNVSLVDVEGVVTFYHFFSKTPLGAYAIYLNNSIVAQMKGSAHIAAAFEKELGTTFGAAINGNAVSLHHTSCIGMNDQEPAAIINGVVFTKLTPDKVKFIAAAIKAGKSVKDIVTEFGDGANQNELVRAMVCNNIMKKGQVLFADHVAGSGLKKAVSVEPAAVIEEMKKSNLRGRGGAGFPAGMKWDYCRQAKGEMRYVLCNADEGEPGTFKDRVLLTEMPELLFEGMTIAGYAIGAQTGILYLRAEYAYLYDYLNNVLDGLRQKGQLGKNVSGKNGFNFDISIQLGAGAYICGEESSLIESAEGKRGEPRNRPPFPVQSGFKGFPTIINNVETFCSAPRIIIEGGDWFKKIGTAQSSGTKLLSVSGDCDKPGIYEIEFGTTVQTLLEMTGGRNAKAVQVGGPSGECIAPKDFGRRICYDDLATGGSIIIFGPDRDIFEVVHNFMEFFIEESCGWCVPCRAGNVIIKEKFEKIASGKGTESDLTELESWCKIVTSMSRCGLGQTSAKPVATTIKNFRPLYEAKLNKGVDYMTAFNLSEAVKESCKAAGRNPHIHLEG